MILTAVKNHRRAVAPISLTRDKPGHVDWKSVCRSGFVHFQPLIAAQSSVPLGLGCLCAHHAWPCAWLACQGSGRGASPTAGGLARLRDKAEDEKVVISTQTCLCASTTSFNLCFINCLHPSGCCQSCATEPFRKTCFLQSVHHMCL